MERRISKKIVGIVLAIMMVAFAVVAINPFTAHAANKVVVHAQVPADWKSPGCYAWGTDADGTKLLGEWPGKALTADSANAGWYTITIDDAKGTTANFIINATGSLQTVDGSKMDVSKGEIWLTVGAKGSDGKFAITASATKPGAAATTTTTTTTTNAKTGVENSVMPIAIIAILACGTVFASKKLKKD